MTNTNFDIPIFAKSYELYKALHNFNSSIDKQNRYTLWQKCQNTVLDIIEWLLMTAQMNDQNKITALIKVSIKIDTLRVFIRLAKETKVIDNKKYIALQAIIDEIWRMLGWWIKTTKNK